MRHAIITSLVIILSAFSSMSYADDQKPSEEKRLSNETSLSLANTSGNTEILSMAGKNELKFKFSEKWMGSWMIGAVYN